MEWYNFFLLIFSLGLMFGTGGFITIRQFYKTHLCGFRDIDGKITGYTQAPASDHASRYRPVIEYNVNGKKYEYAPIVSILALMGRINKKGKRIKLMYNPENPNECVVKHEYFGPLFLLLSFWMLLMCLPYFG